MQGLQIGQLTDFILIDDVGETIDGEISYLRQVAQGASIERCPVMPIEANLNTLSDQAASVI